jgi:proteasome activator subunit 4
MKKPTERLQSLSSVIIYSIFPDSPSASSSLHGTLTPQTNSHSQPSRPSTPVPLPIFVKPTASVIAQEKEFLSKGKTYLAGSKALDSLSKLLQALENFFHPSNHGSWTPILTRFLQNLSFEFLKRTKDEESPVAGQRVLLEKEFRINQEIKESFVNMIRPLLFFSMFSKDSVSITYSHSALSYLAHLSPQSVIPPILSLSFPALQGQMEPHRTISIISSLSSLSSSLIDRRAWKGAGVDLLGLMEAVLPGLDIVDPGKTMGVSLLVVKVAGGVYIGDVEGEGGEGMEVDEEKESEKGMEEMNVKQEDLESDALVRESVGGWEDWVRKFLEAFLTVVGNLPGEWEQL